MVDFNSGQIGEHHPLRAVARHITPTAALPGVEQRYLLTLLAGITVPPRI